MTTKTSSEGHFISIIILKIISKYLSSKKIQYRKPTSSVKYSLWFQIFCGCDNRCGVCSRRCSVGSANQRFPPEIYRTILTLISRVFGLNFTRCTLPQPCWILISTQGKNQHPARREKILFNFDPDLKIRFPRLFFNLFSF